MILHAAGGSQAAWVKFGVGQRTDGVESGQPPAACSKPAETNPKWNPIKIPKEGAVENPTTTNIIMGG